MLPVNQTPYALKHAVTYDRSGAETLLVIVKATYEISQGSIQIAEEQAPVIDADEYRGEPGASSLLYASEMLPPKPATDVLISGHAIATKVGIRQMQVGVQVGNLQHQAMVFGNRAGYRDISKPAPFERIPLCWENAFGGVDDTASDEKNHEYQAENPVGKGLVARKSEKNSNETPLPNIEHPAQCLRSKGDRPTPIGFGPLPPAWLPRRSFAGTYDDEWIKKRAPLLPDDFDDRFLQSAPATLVASSYLQGNESCLINGMTPEGTLQFQMATMSPFVVARFAKGGIRSKPVLETIHIDTDKHQVHLVWKSAINIHGRVEQLCEVEARLD